MTYTPYLLALSGFPGSPEPGTVRRRRPGPAPRRGRARGPAGQRVSGDARGAHVASHPAARRGAGRTPWVRRWVRKWPGKVWEDVAKV